MIKKLIRKIRAKSTRLQIITDQEVHIDCDGQIVRITSITNKEKK